MIRKLLLLNLSILVLVLIAGYSAYAQELESLDIGDAEATPGSYELVDGVYTIKGNGSDIWNNADGFRFAYTTVSGNFEAVVRQLSTQLPGEWAKHGIHARQSVEPGAANAQAIITGGGGGGCQITWRPTADGATLEFMDTTPGPWKDNESWLKLTREGDEFHGYISEDGKDWQDLKSATVVMSDPILVGLAVCGNNNMATTVFDNFIITQNGREVFSSAAVSPEGNLPTTWGAIKLR